jgi:putative endonuclease
MAKKNETGKQGETAAQKYLKEKGYQVLETNWHFHHYELDIVATKGKELIIIEVKTRSGNYLLPPEMAVDKGKIRRTVAAANAYARMKNVDFPVRFDIICLIRKGISYTVENHIEDAFLAPVR